MGMLDLADMRHDDEDLYDLAKGMPEDWEPPEYPAGLRFTLSKEDLAKAGGDGGEPGHTMRFSAMAEVTSIYKGIDECRIELQIDLFAGDDGKLFEPSQPGCICLCGPEMEKMDLDADCERGDVIHLIGTARMESLLSTEWGGDQVCLQITELTCVENESDEAREA